MKRYLWIASIILVAALLTTWVILSVPKTPVVEASNLAVTSSPVTLLYQTLTTTQAITGTGQPVGSYTSADCYATMAATGTGQLVTVTLWHSIDKVNYISLWNITQISTTSNVAFTNTPLYGAWLRATAISGLPGYVATTTVKCVYK